MILTLLIIAENARIFKFFYIKAIRTHLTFIFQLKNSYYTSKKGARLIDLAPLDVTFHHRDNDIFLQKYAFVS